jgi:hypothetical protein
MVVEFRSDKGELNEVDEELMVNDPVVDMTVYCPASIVDVAEPPSEYDSVQATSEAVRAGQGIVSDEVVKLAVTLNDIAVNCRASIAEVDESVSEHDSVQAALLVWARLDEIEVRDWSPLEEEDSAPTEEVE